MTEQNEKIRSILILQQEQNRQPKPHFKTNGNGGQAEDLERGNLFGSPIKSTGTAQPGTVNGKPLTQSHIVEESPPRMTEVDVPRQEHSEPNDKIERSDSPKLIEYQLWLSSPEVIAGSTSLRISWCFINSNVPESELHKWLEKTQANDSTSVLDRMMTFRPIDRTLVAMGANFVRDENPGRKVSLFAVKRSEEEIRHESLSFHSIPSFQLVYQLERHPSRQKRSKDIEDSKNSRIPDLRRPTYLKVHRKHLSPVTLDEYELPWEWDKVSISIVRL